MTETEALLSRFEDRGKGEVQKAAEKINKNANRNQPLPAPSRDSQNTFRQNIDRNQSEQENNKQLPPFNIVADKNQSAVNDDIGTTLNNLEAVSEHEKGEAVSEHEKGKSILTDIPDAKVINEQKIKKFINGIRVKVKNENDNNFSPGVVKEVLNKDTEKPTYVVELDDNSTREVSLSDIESTDFNDRPNFGGAKKKPKRKSKNKTMKKKKKVTKKKLVLKKKKKYTQKKIR